MKILPAITKREQDHFWSVVRECIRKFHVRRASTALAAATRLRKKVGGMPVDQFDLFYHAEPFDVACNLAGQSLDVKDYLSEYVIIRDSNLYRDKAPAHPRGKG
jgi:hypothetical protein